MSQIYSEIMAANRRYATSFGGKATLPMPPARHFVILTCMDARLDPAQYAGLAEGDAHVIRNAGGRATDDAIRSLVIGIARATGRPAIPAPRIHTNERNHDHEQDAEKESLATR